MQQLINIQFLRAFAAILVVIFHLTPHFDKTAWLVPMLFEFFMQFAYAGVDVFFVISGYVIWISSQSKTAKYSSIKFIYNRASRIYLGYWPYFLLLIGLVYWFNAQHLSQVDLVGSFFLTQIGIHKLLLPIAWTLTYELYFYACFSLLLLLPKVWLKPAIMGLIVVIFCVQGYQILSHQIYAHENLPYIDFYLTFLTSPFCLEFLSGCLLGMFFEQHRITRISLPLLAAIGIFSAGIYYQQLYLLPDALMAQGYYLPQRVLFWGMTAFMLVAVMVELDKRGRVVMPKTSELFGGASYSIYLSHIPLIYWFSQLGVFSFLVRYMPFQELAFLLVLGAILFYSVLHYWYIEQPLLRASKSLWQRLAAPKVGQ